jgi:hypothetical protein
MDCGEPVVHVKRGCSLAGAAPEYGQITIRHRPKVSHGGRECRLVSWWEEESNPGVRHYIMEPADIRY